MNELELSAVANEIAKIENRDPNYLINPKWIQLRKMQDYLFSELAKYKIELLKKYLRVEPNAEKTSQNTKPNKRI